MSDEWEWWTGGDQYHRDIDALNKAADAENARLQRIDKAKAGGLSDMTDIVTMMRKVDAMLEPVEANALLAAGVQEIMRLRSLGRKIARPWIDGGVTFKEWCDAVDALMLVRRPGP